MNGLTQEERQAALTYALNGADFMFMPSPELRGQIVQGHPGSIGINDVMTAIILQGKPIRLDSKMIIKYCKGSLDRKNTWLFDNGDIKVVPDHLTQPKLVRTEEDKEFFKNTSKIEENSDEE
jgi:hypothetical protein